MVDDRSPSAKALSVVSQITSISIMAALPGLAGFGLDSWLGTKPLFVLTGAGLGMVAAVYQLAQLVKRLEADANNQNKL